jgi:hypothetical protein
MAVLELFLECGPAIVILEHAIVANNISMKKQ